MKLITREEATAIVRPPFPAPWQWPDPVGVMVSDTARFDFNQTFWSTAEDDARYGRVAQNGDPFAFAVAVEMLRLLYDAGYALVILEATDDR